MCTVVCVCVWARAPGCWQHNADVRHVSPGSGWESDLGPSVATLPAGHN
jgi:hypothetical protein